MKKFLASTMLISVLLSATKAHAIVAAPFFTITINEHSIGGDATFNFHLVESASGSDPTPTLTQDFSIDTIDGSGSYGVRAVSDNGTPFSITQNATLGWQNPTIACRSSNPLVTTTYSDNILMIYGQGFSSIDCDVTNVKAVSGGSSVLFLPGIKGSVLEKGNDTVWPPTIFSLDDVSQLALTANGHSINDVHTDGILNTFYGTPIYGPFSSFMDSLVSDNTIKEWLPLAYDWRFSPDTIVENGIKTATGTIDVIHRIETLAENSKTGKVTIVAHSMGGLLGKAIIKKLQDLGEDDLIDSFVMVGSPQLGTPTAIASMLHGDSEGILAGLIAHPADMRAIAQNMPGAYDLLPSPRYFAAVSDPVIAFDANAAFTQSWRAFWGPSINTYAKFSSFLTASGVPRVKPAADILLDPEILHQNLLTDAAHIHDEYDTYQFPDHIRVIQIAGWGSPTVKAIQYKNNHGIPGYDTLFTVEGDNTVVYPSATSSNTDETYFFNLSLFNKDTSKNTQHRDLLNSVPIQEILRDTITNILIQRSNYISENKPPLTEIDTQLLVSTHSPVILGAYDQSGNFTGVDPNQDLSADILAIKEDIPGSTFFYTNDSQYIFLPKQGSYNFVYKGIGSGPTTVAVENFKADTEIPIASYTDIPTTSATTASFAVESAAPANTAVTVDVDGDGATDEIVHADGNSELSLAQLIALIKQKIAALTIKDKIKQNLLKEVANLEKKIENKRQKNAKVIASIGKKLSNQEMKGKINASDVTGITTLLDMLEAQSENMLLDPSILNDLKTKIQVPNIKSNVKSDLLKRVESLEKKQSIIKNITTISNSILKKSEKGKVSDDDAQALLDLLSQIEAVI